jgi:hypothetical protein
VSQVELEQRLVEASARACPDEDHLIGVRQVGDRGDGAKPCRSVVCAPIAVADPERPGSEPHGFERDDDATQRR